MRLSGFLIAAMCLGLAGCATTLRSQQPPPHQWATGFWFWNGSAIDTVSPVDRLDTLFVQVGTIHKGERFDVQQGWYAYGDLPPRLPAAQEYWLVFRYDRQGIPDSQVIPVLADELYRLQDTAKKRQLNVAGVQLDIDSPTKSLSDYARFLRELRKVAPPDYQISITALLDWFRDGTDVADVVQAVDEFVPQFYDVASPGHSDGGAIAARTDAAFWAPKFNRFHKRFRIGISTFGRARLVARSAVTASKNFAIAYFRDVSPLEIALNPAFRLTTDGTAAGELVLSYQATQDLEIGYNRFHAGDTVQFILPTPDAIRSAVDGVRTMGGYCSGVVFFRWPALSESLAMQPNAILMAAGLLPRVAVPVRVRAINGGCVAVDCVDLYLENPDAFLPRTVRYSIRSSQELAYFLPEQRMPVRMAGPSEIELSLPPYSGRGRMYLGRAVTATHAEYKVIEQP